MKLSLSRDEVLDAITRYCGNVMRGGNWQVTTADYNFPREVEVVEVTPEWLAEQAEAKARREVILKQWEEEAAAKEAAKQSIAADDSPNF